MSKLLKDLHLPNIVDDVESTRILKTVLDLESTPEPVPDWHSTHTFQVFLDALDINKKATSAEDKGSSLQVNIKTSDTYKDEKSDKRPDDATGIILSVEALKILTELPDLSHMTARSFMFPNSKDKSSK